MSPTLKWRIAVGVLIVFVAGIATGVFATAWNLQHRRGGGPRADVIAERMRRHLAMRLRLSPEQLGQISPVIEKTAGRLDTIRAETGRRVAETMDQSRRELAPYLTADQLNRLDQMRERRRRGMRRGHFSLPPDNP